MANQKIQLVAVDVDGTFVRSDYSFDRLRFEKILSRMKQAGCQFVVASGNQYYQLRDLFPDYHETLSFVAENGAYVKDRKELVYTANISKKIVDAVIDMCRQYPEMKMVLCGVRRAYCQRGAVDHAFYDLASIYYHRLAWVDDFKLVDDQILKFALTVPQEKISDYHQLLANQLADKVIPTTSGHDCIDLIVPGCHKASGLKRLVERWQITPEQCLAFGDSENDIEMLQYCGQSYAMANASERVKQAAKGICPSNEDDGVLEILDQLF